MTYSIADQKKFEARNTFVGQRLRTCSYRFFNVLQARKMHIPKLNNSSNPQVEREVRKNILSTVDQYVNCLRSEHRGGELPEYLAESVNSFKQSAYTELAPQYVLEDKRLEIARAIFNENYKE